jgi:Activator of Hsp90 ATPase homolog 1-like protein
MIMKTEIKERTSIDAFEISEEIEIAAPIDIAFEAVLEQLGPDGQMPGGKPFPMKFEPWPGGRWFRDLGNNSGHLWGHVQVIKPPTLLEICGPLMMSCAAVNHLQYRLKEEGGVTRLAFLHRALGSIPPEHRDGMPQGWEYWLEQIRERAERKKQKETKR